MKSTPLEGLAAPPPWWWCLLGDLCFLCVYWLVTRHFRGVTKCPTQACTIPRRRWQRRIDNFRGWNDRLIRFGGDSVEITWSSPVNQFQINFLPTPEQKKHWNLFHMYPGVRLLYQCPGKHVYLQWKRGRIGVTRSVVWEGGLGPCSSAGSVVVLGTRNKGSVLH
jgi:hypothetical protein